MSNRALQRANQRVAEQEQILAEWAELIRRMRSERRDATLATVLFDLFKGHLATYRSNRDRLRQSLRDDSDPNRLRSNISGNRRSHWTDRDTADGEAPGKESGVLAVASEEDAPARAAGVVSFELVKRFAMARAEANVNPPASVPQISGTDT